MALCYIQETKSSLEIKVMGTTDKDKGIIIVFDNHERKVSFTINFLGFFQSQC